MRRFRLAVTIVVLAALNAVITVYADGLPGAIITYERAVMSITLDHSADRLASLRSAAIREAAADSAAATAYRYAQIALLDGIRAAGLDQNRTAEEAFEQAVAYAQEAIDAAPDSEHFRVQADAYMQLLRIKPMPYRIANAGRARSVADEAVELDRSNPRALIAAASYYGSTPAIAGGDRDRAREQLSRAYRLAQTIPAADGGDTLRFMCLLWQGVVARQERDHDAAADYFQRASSIFPDSEWLRQERAER